MSLEKVLQQDIIVFYLYLTLNKSTFLKTYVTLVSMVCGSKRDFFFLF